MVLQHNITAMNAQRQFNITDLAKAKTTEKLSSGYKINRAADDAAGLAISEKMRRQIRGLTQGVSNTQEGISMLQVGDGALAEVHEMLNRMTELSVKAANDTLTADDRSYIQKEITEIANEIDRIGNNTTFNEIYLFMGGKEVVKGADGKPVKKNDFSYDDIKLPNLTLASNPLNSESGATLGFSCKVDNAASAANGTTFGLIYGSGGTSHSKIRLTSATGTLSLDLNALTCSAPAMDASGRINRDFTLKDDDLGIDVTLRQSVGIAEGADSKTYTLNYEVINNTAEDVKVDFLFNADTAYNNNDRKDNYYVGGQRLQHFTVYQGAASSVGDVKDNANVVSGIPASISLVDKDDALPFSENFSWGSDTPNVVSVGQYSSIAGWDYYQNGTLNSLNSTNTTNADLGFTAIWDNRTVQGGASVNFGVNYGIKATENDPNLKDTGIKVSDALLERHVTNSQFWIQSGSEAGVGMYISFGEMNARVLGVSGIDVTTFSGASAAINSAKDALNKVSELRSTIGAQQNRLEHTVLNENNIVENTTAAESAIRDTDMAKEMVSYSLLNILSNAGTSMMTQANQANSTVLSLLQ